MIREHIFKTSRIMVSRESEMRLAALHCAKFGINDNECYNVWNPIFEELLPCCGDLKSVLLTCLIQIIGNAARIAKWKVDWLKEVGSPSLLRRFPACEWEPYECNVTEARAIWAESGGDFHGDALRMIAPKFDPIWIAINDYGVPWSKVTRIGWNDITMDVSTSELKSIGLIYEPRGWLAGLMERETDRQRESLANSPLGKLDPSLKRELMDELCHRPKPRDPKEAARSAVLEMRLGWIADFKAKGDGEGAARIEKMIAETAEYEKRQMAHDLVRAVPADPPQVIQWTGEPFHPRDFDDINPIFPAKAFSPPG